MSDSDPITSAHKVTLTTLGGRLAAVEVEVSGIKDAIRGIGHDVRALSSELKEGRATKWPPLLAAVSLVVAIMGGLITLGARGPLSDLDRLNHEVDGLQEREREAAFKAGKAEGRAEASERDMADFRAYFHRVLVTPTK